MPSGCRGHFSQIFDSRPCSPPNDRSIYINKRIRVGQTSTLTDSSWAYLNTDRLELVKPQHWPTRARQTSTLTDLSWSNLNIDRLELVKPQHWPNRVGQTSTLSDSSWPNLLLHAPPPPPTQHIPLYPSADSTVFLQPLIVQSQHWRLSCSITILHTTLIDA